MEIFTCTSTPSPSSPAKAVPASQARTWLREWSVFLALLCAAFLPVLKWMYDRWSAPDSYTSHGFLVPLISAYLVYGQRELVAREPRRPAATGMAVLVLGLLIFVLSGLLRVYFTSGFALVICLVGMLAYWGGWNWVRRLWFPLAFLVFMLPLPEIAIAQINLLLKLFVTRAAVIALDIVGIPVVMEGAKLQLQNGDLVVGDVCSGLRSMYALIALGVLYAYFYGRKSWLVQAALLTAVIPAALGANMLRIFLNVMFVHFLGKELLFRPLFSSSFTGIVDIHLLSGFLVFIVALLLLHLTLTAAESLSSTDANEPAAKEAA